MRALFWLDGVVSLRLFTNFPRRIGWDSRAPTVSIELSGWPS